MIFEDTSGVTNCNKCLTQSLPFTELEDEDFETFTTTNQQMTEEDFNRIKTMTFNPLSNSASSSAIRSSMSSLQLTLPDRKNPENVLHILNFPASRGLFSDVFAELNCSANTTEKRPLLAGKY